MLLLSFLQRTDRFCYFGEHLYRREPLGNVSDIGSDLLSIACDFVQLNYKDDRYDK